MALRTTGNLQLHHPYVHLFQIAQQNFTLWLMEERANRLVKKQKFSAKPRLYHTLQHVATGVNNQQ